MAKQIFVQITKAQGGEFVSCPSCRKSKLMRIYPETTGEKISMYCRNCKHEIIVDIQQGLGAERVILKGINF